MTYKYENSWEDTSTISLDQFNGQAAAINTLLSKCDEYFHARHSQRRFGSIQGIEEFVEGLDDQTAGIVVSYDYNDSCNCHPEYTTDTFFVPFAVLTDPEAFNKARALDKLEIEQAEQARRTKSEKEAQERAEQLRLKEIATLKQLKEKYEQESENVP